MILQPAKVSSWLCVGGIDNYSISSPADAEQTSNRADYLWDKSPDGTLNMRLFENAVLDGIDFDIGLGQEENRNVLIRAFSRRSTLLRKVYLSAGPQCRFTDAH
ncbi:hypothetical protein BVRB_3g052770 [Beta vulgaris subsp. vulgaris]|nr:hypothetical protein BVRB_3g052770 [Beta vulgaris subsp. vulgaris]